MGRVCRKGGEINTIAWALSALSIYGVWLNTNKDRRCFYIWACTNTAWAYIDYTKGINAQSFLHIIYLILSVKGIISWRDRKYKMQRINF